MSIQEFQNLMGEIATSLEGQAVDNAMAAHLNATFPSNGSTFERLAALCAQGGEEGWLLSREHGGIKFGRAIKPGAEAGGLSVDVVRMKNVKGPHHIHTNGEIGAIMPISGAPRFDEFEPGWYVYPPGSDHHPTVTKGDAYVLYLLPAVRSNSLAHKDGRKTPREEVNHDWKRSKLVCGSSHQRRT